MYGWPNAARLEHRQATGAATMQRKRGGDAAPVCSHHRFQAFPKSAARRAASNHAGVRLNAHGTAHHVRLK
jgi:hypothetical protein